MSGNTTLNPYALVLMTCVSAERSFSDRQMCLRGRCGTCLFGHLSGSLDELPGNGIAGQNSIHILLFLKVTVFFFLRFLFIFREGKGGRKRGRETSMCGCLSHAPYWGPGLQPRHVP